MSGLRKLDRAVVTVDCRELLPPEPLIRVMQAVEKMLDSEAILMLHRQKPCALFPKLEERGLNYEVRELDDGSVQIQIWREHP